MLQSISNVCGIFDDWHRAAVTNAERIKRTRMLPSWIPLMLLLLNFLLIGLYFRYTRELSIIGCAVAGLMLYLGELATAILTLVWACRHYRVSIEALGICPGNMVADFRWSLRICILGAAVIGTALVAGFLAALSLGIPLPAPLASYVGVLGGKWNLQFITLAGLGGATAIILAPVTEELIYRALFFPALTSRLGLYCAVGVSAVVFGLAHVIPFGQVRIPFLEIIGGVLMAAGFAIRWSFIPAMVIHAMGNLFAGMLTFIYVRLFGACPTWFVGQ